MKCLPSCISTLASKGNKSAQQRRREPLGVRLFTCLHVHGATFSIRRASRVRRGRALGLQSVTRKPCHLASNTPTNRYTRVALRPGPLNTAWTLVRNVHSWAELAESLPEIKFKHFHAHTHVFTDRLLSDPHTSENSSTNKIPKFHKSFHPCPERVN